MTQQQPNRVDLYCVLSDPALIVPTVDLNAVPLRTIHNLLLVPNDLVSLIIHTYVIIDTEIRLILSAVVGIGQLNDHGAVNVMSGYFLCFTGCTYVPRDHDLTFLMCLLCDLAASLSSAQCSVTQQQLNSLYSVLCDPAATK